METCRYCSKPLSKWRPGGCAPKTCGSVECKARWARDRGRIYRDRLPKIDRIYDCAVCGTAIVVPAGTMGGPRSLCTQCLEIGPSVAIVRLRSNTETYACSGCGNSFERKPTKGQRPRWCDNCASGRGWKRANPGSRRRSDAKRRAAMAIDAETFGPEEIYERDGWRCQIPGCGRLVRRDKKWPHPLSPSIDHIIPVSEGGHHLRVNVRCAHLRCNTARGNRGGNDQLLLIG